MPIDRDVFLSLLALDSYNRGYGQNVEGFAASGRLGNATILGDALSELDPDDVRAAGFYAIAYNWNGETIIPSPHPSWRGTSFPVHRLAA